MLPLQFWWQTHPGEAQNVTCCFQALSSFVCSPLNSSLQPQGGGIRWILVDFFLWHQQIYPVGSRSSSNPRLCPSGKRGWGWGFKSTLLSLCALLSWALPALFHWGVWADFFLCWLPWGHLSRNSSYDPSVSPFCSARGKAPADFAKEGTNRVAFARNEKWRVVMSLFFCSDNLHSPFLSPHLKIILVWVCQLSCPPWGF